MANEATIIASLNIVKRDSSNNIILQYQSQPNNFRDTVSGRKGPVPGAINVAVSGTNVSLAELTTPGWVRIHNLDLSNYLTWGIFEGTTGRFIAIGELPAGKSCVFKFSRVFGHEYGYGTGTGSYGSGSLLQLRADTAALNALVEAFEA